MKYTDFIRVAQEEDGRNIFGTCMQITNVPPELVLFFTSSNPIDVEVSYPGLGAVKFYPAEDLTDLQFDYELPDGNFVFATCNSDPIFICKSKIFMTLPEVFHAEKIADSFEEFLDRYVTSRVLNNN